MSRPFRLQQPEVPENTIQDAILLYLAVDRRVAWAERFNTGASVIEGTTSNGEKSRRFIQYAFKGCSDIFGQLIDGRFLAVEVKTRTGRATNQYRVRCATGYRAQPCTPFRALQADENPAQSGNFVSANRLMGHGQIYLQAHVIGFLTRRGR